MDSSTLFDLVNAIHIVHNVGIYAIAAPFVLGVLFKVAASF